MNSKTLKTLKAMLLAAPAAALFAAAAQAQSCPKTGGTLTYAVHTFVDNCVTGITANEERCRELVESSVGVITALTPHIGYQHAADIAKRAIVTGQSVRKLILQEKLLTEEEIDTILDPMNLTKPGIPGKELLAHK